MRFNMNRTRRLTVILFIELSYLTWNVLVDLLFTSLGKTLYYNWYEMYNFLFTNCYLLCIAHVLKLILLSIFIYLFVFAIEKFQCGGFLRYTGVWLITRCGSLMAKGYDLGDWAICLIALVLYGVIARVVAFFCLVISQKKWFRMWYYFHCDPSVHYKS